MRPHQPRARRLAVAAVALVTLAGAACSRAGEDPHLVADPPTDAPTTVVAPETHEPAPSPTTATIVRLAGTAVVRAEPDPSSPVVAELAPRTELGSVTALLVAAERDGWVQVHLPVRPNGSLGWIRDTDLERRNTDLSVTVDLAARTLTVLRGGQVAATTAVAVGTDDTPTPTGTFFVTDIVDTDDAAGPYGPFALGLSAHSDVLDQFGGGDGQVGIHGTDAPDSIGQAASHGCIRVPNAVVAELVQALPLGTPVTIV